MTKTKGYQIKETCQELGDLKGKEYAYLGHFAKAKFQKEGHNFMKSEKGANILGAISSGLTSVGSAVAKGAAAKAAKEPVTDTTPESNQTNALGDDTVEPFFESTPSKDIPKVAAAGSGGGLDRWKYGRKG